MGSASFTSTEMSGASSADDIGQTGAVHHNGTHMVKRWLCDEAHEALLVGDQAVHWLFEPEVKFR